MLFMEDRSNHENTTKLCELPAFNSSLLSYELFSIYAELRGTIY